MIKVNSSSGLLLLSKWFFGHSKQLLPHCHPSLFTHIVLLLIRMNQKYSPKWYCNPGNVMLGIGLVHNSLCLLIPGIRSGLLNIINSKNGIIGGVYDEKGIPVMNRSFTEFFLFSGNLMISCGLLMKSYIKDASKPLPSSFGIVLSIFSAFGCIVDPKSGYWGVLALGFYIVYKAKMYKNSNQSSI